MLGKLMTTLAASAVALCVTAGSSLGQATKEITFWSHWAAEMPKRHVRRGRDQADFEAKNPGIKIKATWYEKTALYAGAEDRAAGRPGARHLLRRARPGRVHGERLPARSLGARTGPRSSRGRRRRGPTRASPTGCRSRPGRSSSTTTRKTMSDLGVALPANLQLAPEAFLDMVKKAKAKGMTPMALGVGDRPYPGAHLAHEALLKKLGVDDYDKLLAGQAAVDRSARRRHVEVGDVALTEAGLLPTTFTTLKLGRGARLFPHQPGRADVPERQLVHLARLQPGRQGRAAGQTSRSASCSSRRCLERPATNAGRSPSAAATSRNAATKYPKEVHGVLQLVPDARDGQPLARERAGADRHQERPVEDDGRRRLPTTSR